MHTVKVYMIADQEIKINNKIVNVHDLYSIIVDDDGVIKEYHKIDRKEE